MDQDNHAAPSILSRQNISREHRNANNKSAVCNKIDCLHLLWSNVRVELTGLCNFSAKVRERETK